jgi:flagellar assembly factor FliW
VKFETTRFGEIEVEDGRIFELVEGLIGFPELTRIVILDHGPGSPFRWIQSVDRPEYAFVVVDPLALVPDYPLEELRDALATKERRPVEIGVAAITTVPPSPSPITVNLLAPVVFDAERRVGKQVILEKSTYTTRHVLATQGEQQAAAGGGK